MGLFRLIFYVIVIWLIARIVRRFLPTERQRTEVHGTQAGNEPLDLSDADIEDAEFEEIDDED